MFWRFSLVSAIGSVFQRIQIFPALRQTFAFALHSSLCGLHRPFLGRNQITQRSLPQRSLCGLHLLLPGAQGEDAGAGRCVHRFPGGTGTLEEIAEVMSRVALGQLDAPCIFYNLNGYYDGLRTLLAHMIELGLSSEARQRASILPTISIRSGRSSPRREPGQTRDFRFLRARPSARVYHKWETKRTTLMRERL